MKDPGLIGTICVHSAQLLDALAGLAPFLPPARVASGAETSMAAANSPAVSLVPGHAAAMRCFMSFGAVKGLRNFASHETIVKVRLLPAMLGLALIEV